MSQQIVKHPNKVLSSLHRVFAKICLSPLKFLQTKKISRKKKKRKKKDLSEFQGLMIREQEEERTNQFKHGQ